MLTLSLSFFTGGNSLLGNGTMQRVLADSLIYGPFWNGYGGGTSVDLYNSFYTNQLF